MRTDRSFHPAFNTPPQSLKVTGLGVSRGGVPLLEGIGFEVRRSHVLFLRGPNGAGKTTLLRTLIGLQPPTDGTISEPPEVMALASHSDGLKGTLTVRENLRFWADVYCQELVDLALHLYDLAGLEERPAAALSAGQKRRLGLARMVVTRCPIWLFDEPTVSLDTASVALFESVVAAHLENGGLAVVATHINLDLPDSEILDLSRHKCRIREARRRPALAGFDDDESGAFT